MSDEVKRNPPTRACPFYDTAKSDADKTKIEHVANEICLLRSAERGDFPCWATHYRDTEGWPADWCKPSCFELAIGALLVMGQIEEPGFWI